MKRKAPTHITRRRLLQAALALPALALIPQVFARATKSFDATTLEEAMAELTGGQEPQEHPDIELDAPDVADDGAKVPVQVYAPLPGVESISILVPANPVPLISTIPVSGQVEPYISLRVKMRESSRIIALVRTQDGIYQAEREVSVPSGGCA